MKKMLMLASVASMIDQFNIPNIMLLQEMGVQVDVACNFENGNTCSDEKIRLLKEKLQEMGVGFYQIDFSRSILNFKSNIKAYRQVKKLLKENKYNFVHCHSPIGGVVVRLAGRATKTKVIYTAHGFHFYKGAPIQNWLIYYPVEWVLSFFTHTLVTICLDDFERAKKHMHAKNVTYVPGVGVDLKKFGCLSVDKAKKREELGVPCDAVLLLSVGELNKNKNHETVIKAIANKDVYYIIAGIGDRKDEFQELIDSIGMTERIKLLGFRNDVKQLYEVSDIFVFPSHREGLSVSLMEAMATGLPCVVSKIRGNTDLIDENGGFTCVSTDVQAFSNAIDSLGKDRDLRIEKGSYNKDKVKNFSVDTVLEKMRDIYSQV